MVRRRHTARGAARPGRLTARMECAAPAAPGGCQQAIRPGNDVRNDVRDAQRKPRAAARERGPPTPHTGSNGGRRACGAWWIPAGHWPRRRCGCCAAQARSGRAGARPSIPHARIESRAPRLRRLVDTGRPLAQATMWVLRSASPKRPRGSAALHPARPDRIEGAAPAAPGGGRQAIGPGSAMWVLRSASPERPRGSAALHPRTLDRMEGAAPAAPGGYRQAE